MALVHVLLEDAAARPVFIEALSAYMAGDLPSLSSSAAFGDGADAWGERAMQWAGEAARR